MTKSPPCKQRTCSRDVVREQAWLKRTRNQAAKLSGNGKRSSSIAAAVTVTDDDLAELEACVELGFGFDSPEQDPKLTRAFPALELFYAINKQYSQSLSRTSSMSSSSMSTEEELEAEVSSQLIYPCDDPMMVRERLKQWAKVVACSVRQATHSRPLYSSSA